MTSPTIPYLRSTDTDTMQQFLKIRTRHGRKEQLINKNYIYLYIIGHILRML